MVTVMVAPVAAVLVGGCAVHESKPSESAFSIVSRVDENLSEDNSGEKSSGEKNSAEKTSAEKIPAQKNPTVKWDERIEAPGLSESEFTELCANAVRSVLKEPTVRISQPLELAISDQETQFSIFLDNAWKGCRDAPGQRKKLLSPYLQSLTDYKNAPDQSTQSILDGVIPLIRSKSYFGTQQDIELVTEPFGADLLVVYGVDLPNSFIYLTPQDRKKIKLDDEQLRAKALENLDKILSKRGIEVEETKGVMRFSCGGDFESSLILDRKVMKAIRAKVGSKPIFSVPTRSQLFMIREDSPDGLKLLRDVTQIGFKECDHVISEKLYQLVDGKAQVFN